MSNLRAKFDNEVTITLRSGKTNEILYEEMVENTASDDLFCPNGTIFAQAERSGSGAPPYTGDYPICFILPDDPPGHFQWTGFTYDPSNPWHRTASRRTTRLTIPPTRNGRGMFTEAV